MTTLIACALSLTGIQTPRIEQYVQPDLQDASLLAKVVKGDQRELKKINDDFGQSYRFETTHVRFKEPFKLRLEANVEETNILYIINGPIRSLKVPRLHMNSKVDLSMKPGQRQTVFDFGLLAPSLFKDYMVATFVRTDRATGNLVFDVRYEKKFDDDSRNRIWVDKDKHIVTKREWYNQAGKQLATFLYEKPLEVSGVWIPTLLTVRNVDDVVAGVTRYEGLKVNTGLSDDLFSAK